MKKNILLGLMALLFSASYFLQSCQHTIPDGANCASLNFQITAVSTNATTGNSDGTITVTASGGDGFYFNLNGGSNNTTGVYGNLAAGNYTIIGHNSAGCNDTVQVSIGTTIPCPGVTIVITPTVTNVVPCTNPAANGSISISASGSSGFTYNIGGGAYQASSTFSGLNARNYIIGVKDLNGCTNTQTVVVGTAAKGPNFTNVRNIIRSNCGNCHLNGGNTAGYNFDDDCSIVSYWSQIKGSCVSPYTLRRMPTSGALSATLQAQITAWVNAGHKYTD